MGLGAGGKRGERDSIAGVSRGLAAGSSGAIRRVLRRPVAGQLALSRLAAGKAVLNRCSGYFQVEDDPQRRAVFGTTLELLAVDPELLWRQANLDRRFEVLRYLLTESAPNDSARQLYEMAIDGSGLIHPEATATQGYPICWNDADTTKRIHAALGPIEFSWLAAHFGTAKFLAAKLYKKSLERREIHALHAYFCELKEYYRAAAQANCGTLVLID